MEQLLVDMQNSVQGHGGAANLTRVAVCRGIRKFWQTLLTSDNSQEHWIATTQIHRIAKPSGQEG